MSRKVILPLNKVNLSGHMYVKEELTLPETLLGVNGNSPIMGSKLDLSSAEFVVKNIRIEDDSVVGDVTWIGVEPDNVVYRPSGVGLVGLVSDGVVRVVKNYKMTHVVTLETCMDPFVDPPALQTRDALELKAVSDD